jgi:hypothetical protein
MLFSFRSVMTFASYFLIFVICVAFVSSVTFGVLRDIFQSLGSLVASFGAAFETGRRWSARTLEMPGRRDRLLLALAGNGLVFACLIGLLALLLSSAAVREPEEVATLMANIAIGLPFVFAAAVGLAYFGAGFGAKWEAR